MRESSRHLQRGRVGFRKLTIEPVINTRGEINVTPLVDVVLVLLIIFMVVTPVLEQQLDVVLPTEQRAHASDVAPAQLAVHVDDHGSLAINQRAIAQADYLPQLRELLAPRAPAQRVVFVIVSDGARYSAVVAAMDGAKRAGAIKVGLAVEAGAR